MSTGWGLSSHPGITRALAAIRAAEIGLLRAVAVDAVIAGFDTGTSDILDGLGAELLEIVRAATGPATVRLQAYAVTNGGAWTLLGQTERDVVVSVHASALAAPGVARELVQGVARFVGTHGSVRVDLTRPELDLRRPGERTTLPIGPGRAEALACRSPLAPAYSVPGLLDPSFLVSAVHASARSGTETDITW